MRDRIFITEADYDRLEHLVASRRISGVDSEHLGELEHELERAEVLKPDQPVPPDVIVMNSRVRLLDVDSGEVREYRLIFPTQSRSEDAVSVLAPIGTAILGYRVGNVIEMRVPKGVRRLKVLDVHPQAARDRKTEACA